MMCFLHAYLAPNKKLTLLRLSQIWQLSSNLAVRLVCHPQLMVAKLHLNPGIHSESPLFCLH